MITIDLLKNHPKLMPQVVKIWYELIGKVWVPNVNIEMAIEKFSNHLNDQKLPITFVAFDETEFIGMCSLRENDGIRPDLVPWLGSLVVDPKHQKQGLGKMLIDATKNKARDLGFHKLYLFAYDPTIPQYYGRLGWKSIGMEEFKGRSVTVMETIL